MRTQLRDSYGVPVEGARVEVAVFDSQGGPLREGLGCTDNAIVNQQECVDAGEDWGTDGDAWIDEFAQYGDIQIQTDEEGYKYFRITFTGDDCLQTSTEQWSCSSPVLIANLLNANGAQSEQLQITINNTCLGN